GPSGCEDWDLWVRLARCGAVFHPVAHFLGSYRQSASSYSRRYVTMLEATVHVLDAAARHDLRLQGVPAAPPIAPADYQRLRNRHVFGYFGRALACDAGEDELAALLGFLVPGALNATACADQMLGGLQSGLRER